MTTFSIQFVGAGPGDPELITVKGMRALERADVVVYTGSLVPETLLNWASQTACFHNSASMDLEEIIDIMAAAYTDGKRVVRLHTGDPSLYGAIYEQIVQLERRSIPYQIIPGVTAAFGAAAAMGIEYTVPEISQTLIVTRMAGRTPVPETESLERLAGHRASMAIYLSVAQIEHVASVLESAYGSHSMCAVVYRATHPDEQIIYAPLKELAQKVRCKGVTRQALIIVGNVLNIQRQKQDLRSSLYDRNFSHGYRIKNPKTEIGDTNRDAAGTDV